MSESNSTSDWLYIILTMVAAGVSLIKSASQKNKKKPAESRLPEPELISDQLHDDWENEDVDSYTNIETEPQEGWRYSYIPEEGSEKKKNVLHTQPEEEEIETEGIDFDLKKAVIYNEILNRKYE